MLHTSSPRTDAMPVSICLGKQHIALHIGSPLTNAVHESICLCQQPIAIIILVVGTSVLVTPCTL